MKGQNFSRRLNFALAGLRVAWTCEQSFRTQVLAAVIAIVGLGALQPGWGWGAAVLVCIGLVLAAELFNTALECLADGLHPDQADFVRNAKDCAAGGVLVCSGIAVLVFLAMLADIYWGGREF